MDGSLCAARQCKFADVKGVLALGSAASVGGVRWFYHGREAEAVEAHARGCERVGEISEEVS